MIITMSTKVAEGEQVLGLWPLLVAGLVLTVGGVQAVDAR
jgi:hypothetical protein